MSSEDNNKTVYLLAGAVALLAIVAIVISAIALAKNQSPSVTINQAAAVAPDPKMNPGMPPAVAGPAVSSIGAFPAVQAGKIYTLAIGHDYVSHEYFDQKGYLRGFGINFVDRVCALAGIDCRIVWDRYVNCWDSKVAQHATGGQGLHDRWYDACTGWYTTIERSHVFQFSQSYLKEPLAYFYVLYNNNLDTSKASLESSKIVYIDGWASDEKCMTRVTGAVMNPSNIAYANTPEKAVALLKATTYNVIFTTESTMRQYVSDNTVTKIPTSYSCMIAGSAIMARKDSDIISHVNRGFSKMKSTSAFKKFCDEQNEEHKARGNVECVDNI